MAHAIIIQACNESDGRAALAGAGKPPFAVASGEPEDNVGGTAITTGCSAVTSRARPEIARQW